MPISSCYKTVHPSESKRYFCEPPADAPDKKDIDEFHRLFKGYFQTTKCRLFLSNFDSCPQDVLDFGVMYASIRGNVKLLRLCLDKGGNAKFTAAEVDFQCTPLHVAAQKGHTRVVRELLKRGADITAITTTKETALHLAADKRREAVVAELLKNGAPVNSQDNGGNTPLSHANRHNDHDIRARLFAAGATSHHSPKSQPSKSCLKKEEKGPSANSSQVKLPL